MNIYTFESPKREIRLKVVAVDEQNAWLKLAFALNEGSYVGVIELPSSQSFNLVGVRAQLPAAGFRAPSNMQFGS